MRAVVQRVSRASVKVNGTVISEIDNGLLVYLGVMQEDDNDDLLYMERKISALRIFDDTEGRMNLSVMDKKYSILLVSQFTICGNVKRGNRPSFDPAAEPDAANEMYEELAEMFRRRGILTETGKFQAHMKVESLNDGPVTVLIDSRKIF